MSNPSKKQKSGKYFARLEKNKGRGKKPRPEKQGESPVERKSHMVQCRRGIVSIADCVK